MLHLPPPRNISTTTNKPLPATQQQPPTITPTSTALSILPRSTLSNNNDPTTTTINDDTQSHTALQINHIKDLKLTAATKTTTSQFPTSTPQDTFIHLTPSIDQITGKETQERVIRMVSQIADPLEPAMFKFRAMPRPPGSPPAPVLHGPATRITEQEASAWVIPASTSNWTNPKGHTLSLDKRLAATGGGLDAPEVNDNFARVAEALLTTEEQARVAVAHRAKLKQQLEERRRKEDHETLRIAAAEALAARATRAQAAQVLASGANATAITTNPSSATNDDDDARQHRDALRAERKKEIERELRLEAAGKKTNAQREQDRDISERVALGMPVPKATSGEAVFDSRLFNQSQGMSGRIGEGDDDDIAFTTSLFKDRPKGPTFKPTQGMGDVGGKLQELKAADRFVGFKGDQVEREAGPVQFERARGPPTTSQEDPDSIFGVATTRHTRKELQSASVKTMMARGTTTSSSTTKRSRIDEDFDDDHDVDIAKEKKWSKSTKMDFVKGSTE